MAKRKRKGAEEGQLEGKGDGADIVGGLKDPTGNSRSAGLAANDTDKITNFKVPFNEKQIVCERHHGVNSESAKSKKAKAATSLAFTHGAGGGIENPATRDFVTGFATAAKQDAICFQGTMNLSHRTKTFHAVLENQGRARALGGRSMGSRAAVITATECEDDSRPEALVLVSYPLTSEKGTKAKEGVDPRTQILLDLPKSVDVLFVIGSKDSMCDVAALNEVRDNMKSNSWVIEVNGADHGMSLTPKAGVQPLRLRSGALAAEWLENRDDHATVCYLAWDKEAKEITESGWYAPKKQKVTSKQAKEKPNGDKKTMAAPKKKRKK